MNIDQALIALCRKHDLTALTVGPSISPMTGCAHFTAFAHFVDGNHPTARMAHEATATEAIAHAIQQVNEARACVVDVPAMELECEA